MNEHASEIRGFPVISRKEGAMLGTVAAIYLDTAANSVAALSYRPRRMSRDRYYVAAQSVQIVGRDIVLIGSESDTTQITDASVPAGQCLKELQGSWVTTSEGKHLGALADVDFSQKDWAITRLILSEDRSLPVDANDIRIGDEIIVPAEYADRLEVLHESDPGVLRRIFGTEPSEPKHTHEDETTASTHH